MTGRFLALASATALLAACSGSGPHYSARHLQQRLQTELTWSVETQRAAIQPLREGALVTLYEPALFAANSANLTPDGRFTLASVAESLLDPSLMQVAVRAAPATSVTLREQRALAVQHFVEEYSLGPPLALAVQPQPSSSTSAQGLTMEIHVVCPPGPQGSTWKYQVAGPTCD